MSELRRGVFKMFVSLPSKEKIVCKVNAIFSEFYGLNKNFEAIL